MQRSATLKRTAPTYLLSQDKNTLPPIAIIIPALIAPNTVFNILCFPFLTSITIIVYHLIGKQSTYFQIQFVAPLLPLENFIIFFFCFIA